MKKKTAIVMKDNSPKAVNGVRNVMYEEITKVPLAHYLQKSGRFLNTAPAVFYDTAVFGSGVAITPVHEAELFTKGINKPSEVVNSGTAINKKSKVLTNMVADGEFDGGRTFILEEIQVDLFLLSDNVTTMTNGEISNPTLTALANYSASAHYYAITRQFELVYMRNEQPIFSGLLYEFPSHFVASGAFGNDEGFIQNGFARDGWNKLDRARVLESNDKFSVMLRPLAASFTPQVDFNIRVNLIGKAINPLFE